MEARIRNDDLEGTYRVLMHGMVELQALTKTKPKKEWELMAKKLQSELTLLLRRIQTTRPGTSAERLFVTDANGKVLSALSSLQLMLR
ncbi:MAG: hypothetical protein WCV90_00260 [Candidatus Woesearchaeota archaeon]|jgi:hypothetical protein